MTPLDRVHGVNAEQAAFLAAVGVNTAEELAQADDRELQRELDRLGTRRGRASLVPSLVTVRLWIQAARESTGLADPDSIPEAIAVDDIPEVLIERDGQVGPPPVPVQAPHRETPRRRPLDQVAQTLRPPPPSTRPQPAEWKGVEKGRFQTIEEYAEGARGIEPLRRKPNPITDSDGPAAVRADGTLSRRHRRGVLYPFPGRAIFGALVSIVWRLAVVASLIAMPAYIYMQPEDAPRKHETVAVWAVCLLALALLQVWVASKVRCRVCGCHLYKSLRCSKNRKAHLLPLAGHVFSLSLHLLLFQWFRCMYCGTAIRLFGRKSKGGSATDAGEA